MKVFFDFLNKKSFFGPFLNFMKIQKINDKPLNRIVCENTDYGVRILNLRTFFNQWYLHTHIFFERKSGIRISLSQSESSKPIKNNLPLIILAFIWSFCACRKRPPLFSLTLSIHQDISLVVRVFYKGLLGVILPPTQKKNATDNLKLLKAADSCWLLLNIAESCW